MSLERHTPQVGMALVVEDAQRAFTDAAGGDDAVYEVLATPGAALKRIVPLDEETATVNPRILAYPGTGADAGKVYIRRCALIAAVADAAGFSVDLEATNQNTALASPAIPSTSHANNPAYFLVYATIARAVSEHASRLQRDSSDIETSSDVNLFDAPTITLGVSAEAANENAALALLPSDTSTAWAFPLCVVKLTDPWTAGTLLSQSNILQEWTAGGIPQDRALSKVIDLVGSERTGDYGTRLTSRWKGQEHWEGIFAHAAGETIELDSSVDWRLRRLRVRFQRAAADSGAYPSPDNVAVPGGYNRECEGYTGTGGTTSSATIGTLDLPGIGSSGGDITFDLWADSSASGALKLTIVGSPAHAGGDVWMCSIDVTGRFESL